MFPYDLGYNAAGLLPAVSRLGKKDSGIHFFIKGVLLNQGDAYSLGRHFLDPTYCAPLGEAGANLVPGTDLGCMK